MIDHEQLETTIRHLTAIRDAKTQDELNLAVKDFWSWYMWLSDPTIYETIKQVFTEHHENKGTIQLPVINLLDILNRKRDG